MSTDLDPEGVTLAYIPIRIPNSQLVEFACLLSGDDESILRDAEEAIAARITTGIAFDGFPEMDDPVLFVNSDEVIRLTDHLELW